MASVAHIVQVTPTTPGTVDFTETGFGTATGAIVQATWATALNSILSPYAWSICITDFTTSHVRGTLAEDNSTTTDVRTYNESGENNSVRLYGPTDATLEILGEMPTVITDGIRINFTTVGATLQHRVLVTLFKDVDIDVREHETAIASFPGSDVISGLSFAPKGGISLNGTQDFRNIGLLDHGMGAFLNDGSDKNAGAFFYEGNNRNPSDLGGYFSTSEIGGRLNVSGTLLDYCRIDSYTSDGYSVTFPDDDIDVGLMSVSDDCGMVVFDTPTVTGNYDITGLNSVNPDWVGIIPSTIESIDTGIVSGSELMAGGFSSITSTSQYSVCVVDRDGVSPTETASALYDKALVILDPTNPAQTLIEADYVSMEADKVTLNFTKVAGTAKKCIMLVVGTQEAAAVQRNWGTKYEILSTPEQVSESVYEQLSMVSESPITPYVYASQAAIDLPGHYEFSLSLKRNNGTRYEINSMAQAVIESIYEFLGVAYAEQSHIVGWSGVVERDISTIYEMAGFVKRNNGTRYEINERAALDAVGVYEFLAQLAAERSHAYDYGGIVSAILTTPWSSVYGGEIPSIIQIGSIQMRTSDLVNILLKGGR